MIEPGINSGGLPPELTLFSATSLGCGNKALHDTTLYLLVWMLSHIMSWHAHECHVVFFITGKVLPKIK